jgi:hypothetical protein
MEGLAARAERLTECRAHVPVLQDFPPGFLSVEAPF